MRNRTLVVAAIAAIAAAAPSTAPLRAAELSFMPCGWFRPYLGAGASYFLPDHHVGDALDELGYYAADAIAPVSGVGPVAFTEALPRAPSGQVGLEPGQVAGPDDLDLEDRGEVTPAGVEIDPSQQRHF